MNKTFNIVFTGTINKCGVKMSCATVFDTGWKPLLVYKSPIQDKNEMIAELLKVYPKGFVIVPVNWGPKHFPSFIEFASFVSNTTDISMISGPRTFEDLKELNVESEPLISADVYNGYIASIVSRAVDVHCTGFCTNVIRPLNLPEWFIPVYKIRRELKEPLVISCDPKHRNG